MKSTARIHCASVNVRKKRRTSLKFGENKEDNFNCSISRKSHYKFQSKLFVFFSICIFDIMMS